ncbi:MAG TPA: capsule assembly Wzi family protein, partial [Gemmatirosa sp.]
MPAVARAQSAATRATLPPAATVAPDEPVARDADAMLALAPVPGGIVGQRPYSVRELTRLARAVRHAVAERSRAGAPSGAAARADALAMQVLDALGVAPDDRAEPRPTSGIRLVPLQEVLLSSAATDAPLRRVPVNGQLGGLDALTLPPLDGRFGRPAVDGVATSLETVSALGVGRWLAVVAQPRLSWTVAPGDAPVGPAGSHVTVEPQRLYVRAVVANVAVQAGVDERVWGQAPLGPGMPGGTLVSANAPPLHAVSIGADTAFVLPWLFRHAGRIRAELVVANLGARDQLFPHSTLAFYKVTLSPTPNVELGAGIMDEFGGSGAPPLPFASRVTDLFPFLTWLKKGADKQESNKIAPVDVRVRIPALRSATAYWELSLDDFDARRLRSVLWQDAGHLFGLSLPRLRDDGALALDAFYQHTSLRLYEHGQFQSGITYRERIIGSPLGPNGESLTGALAWRAAPTRTVRLVLSGERRDPSPYATTTVNGTPNGALKFVQIGQAPVEGRVRAQVALEQGPAGRGTSVTGRLGADRVTNENFVAGRTRVRPFGEAGVRVGF